MKGLIRMQFISIASYVIFAVAGLVLFKYGSKESYLFSFGDKTINFQIGYISAIGLICYAVSFILYLNLISKYSLSYIVPVAAGAIYVIIFLSSVFLFKEGVTMLNVLGNICIITGIILLNLKK